MVEIRGIVRMTLLAASLVFVGAIAGCASSAKPQPAPTIAGMMTADELDQLNKGFADRFVVLLGSVCEEIEKDNPSLYQRRKAHELKLYCATNAFDVATNADCFTSLLDLTLSVTLVSQVWIDENRAEEVFGERAALLIAVLRRARVEIWTLAARVMKQEQLEALDLLIWRWRHANPEVEHVQFIRCSVFAASRGKNAFVDIGSSGGLFADVSEASKAIGEARLVAERAFYLAKRAPVLLEWQAKALANDLLSIPEIAQAADDLHNASATLEQMTKVAQAMPAQVAQERKAILSALGDREKSFGELITNARTTIADIERLLPPGKEIAIQLQGTTDSLNKTLALVDALAVKYLPPEELDDRKPFDIGPYTQAVVELHGTANALHKLLESTAGAVESPIWTRRITEVNTAADDRMLAAANHSEVLVDRVFNRFYVALAAIFVMVLILRTHAQWLRRRAARESNPHLLAAEAAR